MNIKCPNCSTNNTIEFAENICCHTCKKSFAGFSFRKYKMPIAGVTSVLLIATLGGLQLESYVLEPRRYSTAAIYEIVSYCANPTNVMITQSMHRQLAEECICALNKTMVEISESELTMRAGEFTRLFNNHRSSCY